MIRREENYGMRSGKSRTLFGILAVAIVGLLVSRCRPWPQRATATTTGFRPVGEAPPPIASQEPGPAEPGSRRPEEPSGVEGRR